MASCHWLAPSPPDQVWNPSQCFLHRAGRGPTALEDLLGCLNPLVISRNVASCNTFMISRIDFRHDHCK